MHGRVRMVCFPRACFMRHLKYFWCLRCYLFCQAWIINLMNIQHSWNIFQFPTLSANKRPDPLVSNPLKICCIAALDRARGSVLSVHSLHSWMTQVHRSVTRSPKNWRRSQSCCYRRTHPCSHEPLLRRVCWRRGWIRQWWSSILKWKEVDFNQMTWSRHRSHRPQ